MTAPNDDDGGIAHGAVWILYLTSSYQVRSHAKISDTEGGFGGALDDFDELGRQAAILSDLDGNGVPDLIVSQHRDDDGGPLRGAAWIIYLPEPSALSLLIAGIAGLLALQQRRKCGRQERDC